MFILFRRNYPVLFPILVFFCTLLLLLSKEPAELSDDGAFFFRYAENILQGEFWVWNKGQPPIWGASAPLFPLLLAIPLGLGFSAQSIAIHLGALLFAAATTLSCYSLHRFISHRSSVVFFLLILLNQTLQNWSISGMESSVTLFILSLSLFRFLNPHSSALSTGLSIGLLGIHKIDLVPIAFFLILHLWWKRTQFPKKETSIALLFFCCWFLFAYAYFGSVLPTSFWHKFQLSSMGSTSLSWHWFPSLLFLHGSHFLLCISLLPFVFSRSKTRLEQLFLSLLCSSILSHVLAYSLYPPIEPYAWYSIPSLFLLLLLSSIGLSRIAEYSQWLFRFCLILIGIIGVPTERQQSKQWMKYLETVERDRSNAGRWINEHTANDSVILTGWGNAAYHSHREVIDSSFLHRHPSRTVWNHRSPPIYIIYQGTLGSSPDAPEFDILQGRKRRQYELVKLFDQGYQNGFSTYYGVLKRKELP